MVHVIEESFDFRYLSTKIDKAKKNDLLSKNHTIRVNSFNCFLLIYSRNFALFVFHLSFILVSFM